MLRQKGVRNGCTFLILQTKKKVGIQIWLNNSLYEASQNNYLTLFSNIICIIGRNWFIYNIFNLSLSSLIQHFPMVLNEILKKINEKYDSFLQKEKVNHAKVSGIYC